MDTNPYASPQSAEPSPIASATPPLYPPRGVLMATFLGSFLGGAIVLAINFRRLGRPTRAWATLLLGLIVTAVFMGLVMSIPDNVKIPNMTFVALQMGAMYIVAKATQPDVERLINAGVPPASSWRAAGWGLLACLIVVAMIVAYVLATMDLDAIE